ncbi:Rha family transcriptional regulator [Pseudomonas amygdali pv. lachrymans]|uniref:Phage regulatory protein n=3 Tax=Pseudomonas syringae group TaxID=136849 RepID=A0AAD0LXH0_PSEAV|nr:MULTISPECIES: Rha family transcriptional regulator [Pseudomonas syringae group]ARA80184.1 phage regulatory protein [Pseudomonas amygdali pv. lachrymans]AXH55777.1 phage regulatory protein [Pseudomonas amygdali pv. lachrymans str. M301315]MCF5805657.1 phage regulatory protein [Pseudomonas tremae]MCF5810851.1 phage regulatory protein [Pseudomonas tremae]PWD03422.1 phage regulatory protein [Pseudomonas amygdali pv. lachrymans]
MAESIVTSSNANATSEVSIELVKGQPMTTSVDIASHFGKLHKNVIKAIKALDCTDSFHKLNFEPIQIDVDLGMGRTRKDPAFRITRDGFTFLCMGFTGKEAARWKEAYINAFNQMELALKAQPVEVDNKAVLAFALKTLELMRGQSQGRPPRPNSEQVVQTYLDIQSLDQATAEQVKLALIFVQGQIIGEGSAAVNLPNVAGSSIAKDLLYGLLRSAHDAELMFNALYDKGVEALASDAFKNHMTGKLADTSRQARELLGYVASHAARTPFAPKFTH